MQKIWNLCLKCEGFLITKLEFLTQKFQKLTGKDNFWLCRIVLVLCGTLFFIGCLSYNLGVMSMLFYMLSVSYLMARLRKVERGVKGDATRGLSNSAKIDIGDIVARLINLTLFSLASLSLIIDLGAISWAIIILHSAYLIFIIYLYMEACDPLPPCKGKIKEWLQSLFFTPKVAEIKT